MRSNFIYVAIFLVGAMIIGGCNAVDTQVRSQTQKTEKPAAGPVTPHGDGVRRITTEELEELMKKGQAFVVDVRNQASYDSGHIPGAKLIPTADILKHVDELPRDKTIVTYCS